MNPDRFSELMASLSPSMAIVTTAVGDRRDGCLVGFHSQCSIDPPRYAVWLSKANRTFQTALGATHLGVHFLEAGQRGLAELFGSTTGDDIDKFRHCESEPGPGGVPLLTDCRKRLVGGRVATIDAEGDHVCFILDPIDAVDGPTDGPLRLSDVTDLSPGHEADDSRR